MFPNLKDIQIQNVHRTLCRQDQKRSPYLNIIWELPQYHTGEGIWSNTDDSGEYAHSLHPSTWLSLVSALGYSFWLMKTLQGSHDGTSDWVLVCHARKLNSIFTNFSQTHFYPLWVLATEKPVLMPLNEHTYLRVQHTQKF